ncbi:family 1 glycosylhydrolase [uncultured Oscillibacter sp.]|uniref:family 1 glycosylhydrolase n=1 Tax=uncultured Oscillibacter sp. TaxID=876091 RepID=UPI0026030F98|nr:family 1 glycosylhydrolase [uncultured Oscillibacter sp.]
MQARYQALHHQFVASARVVKYAHEHYPQFKLGNMICFGAAYPYTCSPDDMLEAQHQMRNMNWYCSDVQVKGEYPYYAKAFWKPERHYDQNGARRLGGAEAGHCGLLHVLLFT